ncbi:MAG: sialidase family protein [Planctomycetota bacterium]|nr:sialidase family protein [Planctomycetota bacterium]
MPSRGVGRLALAALRDLVTGRLAREWVGPSTVPLRQIALADGLTAMAAPDMMAQAVSSDGAVLATRGYHLYQMRPGDPVLRRLRRLPCPGGTARWLHYSCLRRHVRRSDVATVFPLPSGAMLTLAGGRIYRGEASGEGQPVFRLRYWGSGVGCGVMYCGIVRMPNGTLFFGEYTRNTEYDPVHLYASDDDGRTWRLAHAFPAGTTRHIHSVQADPFGQDLWLCAGDRNDHSFIAHSSDEGKTFERIGEGSQQWRSVRLQFTPEHVWWASDTNHPDLRAVFRWSRKTRQVEKLVDLDGPAIMGTALGGGTWIFGTDREGLSGMQWVFGEDQPHRITEWDEHPSIWMSADHERWVRLALPRWSTTGRPTFGVPHFAIGENAPCLAFTIMNVEQYDNHLFVIPEQALKDFWSRQKSGSPTGLFSGRIP